MSSFAIPHPARRIRRVGVLAFAVAAALLLAVLVWQGITSSGNPNPTAPQTTSSAAVLDIGVLVFREGLECILVLAAITAGMTGEQQAHRRPVAMGAGVGFLATLLTWFVAVGVLNDISQKISALNLQAVTGLLAIVVLLIVMNWFFHKMYWTGWISLHNRRKRELLEDRRDSGTKRNVLLGMGLLGFSSMYREGVEVVLFLQSYRLKLGNEVIFYGVLIGLFLSAIVTVLTFAAHRKLPYRKMLIVTGILLSLVLFVMVGEQIQEMQLAHWLPTTTIRGLADKFPSWIGLWFSIFPTVETLTGQALALVLVFGSYFVAERSSRKTAAKLK
ncbi:FTR1 family protein [Granulicella sp. S156]|uniref:FTR1 family iron permease n=1 Tax=Granulicella sp. S156 TaxID=1747224 RepID=UPI0020B16D55|nr:FTR1 family protein [Granulicella sp. S156]